MSYREEAPERARPGLVEVAIAFASDSQFYADLSGQVVGVFASTFLVCPTGTPIELLVSFPDGASFFASGTVQFVRTADTDQLPGLGIAFTKLAPEDRDVVIAFSAQVRPPMFYEEP